MLHPKSKYTLSAIGLGGIVILLVLITGCGAANSMSTNAPTTMGSSQHSAASSLQSQATSSGAKNDLATQPGPQYLAKTLKVSMNVKDTRSTASELQSWISTSDPLSSSAGTDYEQTSNNLYNISLTYSIEAANYPKVYQYLRDYTTQKGGHLATFTETVQDVTGNYVDTQSRIKNLQTEQARLQDLMSHAQALSDIMTLDKSLTDVEGQIETYEAQLNTLTSQVAFYTVTITLQPIDTTPSLPAAAASGWSIGQTLHDAFAASVALAQGVITFLIWLLAFAIYIIPVLVIIWLVRRWQHHTPRAIPHPAETISTPSENA